MDGPTVCNVHHRRTTGEGDAPLQRGCATSRGGGDDYAYEVNGSTREAIARHVRRFPPVVWARKSAWRRALLAVGGALVLVGIAFVLIGRAAKFGEVTEAAARGNKLWFPICLLGEVLAYAGYILAYRDVARAEGGPELDLWTVTRIVVLGFGAVVVGSGAGGLAVDFWALRRAGAGAHGSTRRVLALNTLEWGVISFWAALAGLAVLLGAGEGVPLAMALAWLCVVPACVVAAAWTTQAVRVKALTAIPHGPPARGLLPRGRHALRIAFADAIGGVLLVRHIVLRPMAYPAALIGFPIYWLGDLVTLYGGLRAFGVTIGVAPLVLAYTTSYVATALPLPFAGAGGIEAALTLTLHLVGVPLAAALLGVLVYRLFSLWLPIVPALLFLPSIESLEKDVEAVSRRARHAA